MPGNLDSVPDPRPTPIPDALDRSSVPAHVAVVAQLREVADWVLCDFES